MLLKIDIFYIPTTFSLAVVATIITVSIILSLRATRGQGRRTLPADRPAVAGRYRRRARRPGAPCGDPRPLPPGGGPDNIR